MAKWELVVVFAQILLFDVIKVTSAYDGEQGSVSFKNNNLKQKLFQTDQIIDSFFLVQSEDQSESVAKLASQFEFTNIKNQITAKIFSEYDAQRLKIITDSLGCKTVDCPQLISASNIEYNILELVGREYIGRGEKQPKVVIQSTDTEISNASPVQQNISTVSYVLKCIENYELTITKTTQIRTEKTIDLFFYKKTTTTTFTKKDVERTGTTAERTVQFPSQNVTVEPLSKLNVTFNFVQYDDINNYLIDFQIADNSTLSHLDVVGNDVVFVQTPLGEFLRKNIPFISTLKYDDAKMLKLIEKDGKFILKNFPTSETITNFGVDVIFGKATSLAE